MYIARQPIFNRHMNVYGYELLFRNSSEAVSFDGLNPVAATATVLGGLFESGISQIVDGKKAFVNFDYDFLLSDTLELIDPKILVIEVLEYVESDGELLDRLAYLKNKGYAIALDDFIINEITCPLISSADIIKYDIMATPLKDIKKEIKGILKQNKILLAEKIETAEEFLEAKELGFSLFQGYFFSKPCIVCKSNESKTLKVQYGRVIAELRKEEPSYHKIASIIETDVNLAYRLMRVTTNRRTEGLGITIRKALVLMGLKEIERWISILMLQDLSEDKPKELLRLSMVRSKFAEIIAANSKLKQYKNQSYLMGLFSALDAMLNQSMEQALMEVALPEEIKSVLIKQEGPLKPILDLIICYEQGNWEAVGIMARELDISGDDLSGMYLEAIDWTKQVLKSFL